MGFYIPCLLTGSPANSTIAVRRLHEGALYFQEARMQAARQDGKER
jgi:hypothetical protein